MPRNAQGQYFLPDGNPVVPGTTIQADWANPTLEDIAQALSDSLDRDGQGGMKAPLKHVDGSEATPSMTFTNDTSTGLSLKSTGVMGVSCGAKSVAEISKNGVTMVNDTEVFVAKAPSIDSSLTNKKYVDDTIRLKAAFVGQITMCAPNVTLPPGWFVCDGTNGTVDLRDKFILAGGTKFAAGSKGGSLTIGLNNMPKHSHGGVTSTESNDHHHNMGANQVSISGNTGGAGGHSHGVSDPGHGHSYNITNEDPNYRVDGNSGPPGFRGYSYVSTSASGTGIGIQGVGDHTHPLNGVVSIAGDTGGISENHTHSVSAEGSGEDYIQPYYALVFAQYMGVTKHD